MPVADAQIELTPDVLRSLSQESRADIPANLAFD